MSLARSSIGRWLIVNLILGIFPLIIVLRLSFDAIEKQFLENFQATGEKLQDVLFAVNSLADPQKWLKGWLRKVFWRLQPDQELLPKLKKIAQRFEKAMPGLAKFAILDKNGDLFWTNYSSPPKLNKLFFALLGWEKRKDHSELKTLWPEFKSFIGFHSSVDQITDRDDHLIMSKVMPTREWFGYRVWDNGGLLCHFFESPDWKMIMLDYFCRRVKSRFRKSCVKLGTWNAQFPKSTELQTAISKFMVDGKTTNLDDNFLYSIWEVSPGKGLWASFPFNPKEKDRKKQVVLYAAFTVWLLFACGSFILLKKTSTETIPIRRKLLGFFLCSGLPPLILVFVTGDLYIEMADRSRRSELFQKHLTTISGVGQDFIHDLGLMESRLNRVLASASYAIPEKREKLLADFSQLLSTPPDVEINVYDSAGEIAWSSEKTSKEKRNRTQKILSGIFSDLLKICNREPIESGPNTVELLIDMLGIARNPLDELKENNKRIAGYSWFSDGSFGYIQPLTDKTGRFSHLVALIWRRIHFERSSLEKSIKRLRRLMPHSMPIGVRSISLKVTPKGVVLTEDLKKLIRRLQFLGKPVKIRTVWNGKKVIFFGMKSKEIDEAYIFIGEPELSLEESRKATKAKLNAFLWGALVLNLILGIALANQFLTPLNLLETGLTALGEHRFTYRIPIPRKDEFGELLMTFNGVVESLGELQVAQVIHENLFPEKPLLVSPYLIRGKSIAASRLGGDFLDFRILPDGKIMVIIGDVSGHGVPAALIMAMMKAVIEDQIHRDCSLVEFVLAMNSVLLSNFRGKWTLTAFFGFINPEENTLEFVGAAHPYPWLFRSGCSPQPLKNNCFLLGCVRKPKVAPEKIGLQPGDKIFCFTDGILETEKLGENLTIENSIANVSNAFAQNPDASLETLFEFFNPGIEDPLDDKTILVLSVLPVAWNSDCN